MSTISPQQILADRQARKDAGLVGCITGKPAPEIDFFGFRDVQIWRTDSQGRMPGMDGFDPRDPGCFCFDCRGSFDSDGVLDAELVNEGHERACYTYRSLLNQPEPIDIPTSLPSRTVDFVSVENEKQEANLINTLEYFRGYLDTQLVRTMNKRMNAKTFGEPQGTIDDLDEEEDRLQDLDDLAQNMLELLRA